MLCGVIFDMDGVLINSHPAHRRAWQAFFRSVGREVSDSELEFILNGAKREEILVHFLGTLTPKQLLEYGRRKDAMFRQEAAKVEKISGLEAFLQELTAAHIARAVATSASRSRTEHILGQLGLIEWFGAIVTGDDVPKGKPDPALFLMAAHRLGISPNNLLVVEDAVSGIKAAKTAGMKCLAITSSTNESSLPEAGADMVARDFRKVRLCDLRPLFP